MLVTTPPTELLVEKADLREYCGITDDTDDTTITRMLKAAQLDSERILNRAVARQSRRMVVDALTPIFVIEPVHTLDSIKVLADTPEAEETIDASSYLVFNEEALTRVLRKNEEDWPEPVRRFQSFEINFTGGWTMDDVPDPVVLMIMAQVKFYYEHRGEPFQKASKDVQSVIRHDLDLLAIASRYKFLGTELTEGGT